MEEVVIGREDWNEPEEKVPSFECDAPYPGDGGCRYPGDIGGGDCGESCWIG